MFCSTFSRKKEKLFGKDAIVVSGLWDFDLADTMECGQCFRHVMLAGDREKAYTGTEGGGAAYGCGEGYTEYMTVAYERIIRVGQRSRGELIFYEVSDEDFENICLPYFSLDKDFAAIREDILRRTDSDFLHRAAEDAKGVRLLSQEPWEALFSFIISQNNNIPRIRRIIRSISLAYGRNLAKDSGLSDCPLGRCQGINPELCADCGACYSFPRPEDVAALPEKLLPSHPGFRYRYLIDAAERIASGDIDLEGVKKTGSYEYSLSELKRIVGVGDKVASCVALFALSNFDAFPIDVWMKRAIDEYFGGSLNAADLGPYAGVAQQYIFHYIRNLSEKEN